MREKPYTAFELLEELHKDVKEKGEIGAISISKGSYTGTMKPGKDTIKVSLKCTTVDSVES